MLFESLASGLMPRIKPVVNAPVKLNLSHMNLAWSLYMSVFQSYCKEEITEPQNDDEVDLQFLQFPSEGLIYCAFG